MTLQKPTPILQLIDSLNIGGAERVAVNIANALPHELFDSHLGVTRSDGPLRTEIATHVHFTLFERRGRFDFAALYKLVSYIRKHNIAIIHAHSTSLFIAVAAAIFFPGVRVIWHDHFGRFDEVQRSPWPYRFVAHKIYAVIAVSEHLAHWAHTKIGIRSDRTYYLPNFSTLSTRLENPPSDLRSVSAQRIVCVANLRPQKDHITLVRAMALVIAEGLEAHLLLVGSTIDEITVESIRSEISHHNLESAITIMGVRTDVRQILGSCSVGVLSSKSEGFPLALIEYGEAGLAVIATHVGQCAEILANGEAGILVAPENPSLLATAIIRLLRSPQERKKYSQLLGEHVRENYGTDAIIGILTTIYNKVMADQFP